MTRVGARFLIWNYQSVYNPHLSPSVAIFNHDISGGGLCPMGRKTLNIFFNAMNAAKKQTAIWFSVYQTFGENLSSNSGI